MAQTRGACLVCGKQLVYFQEAKEMECYLCHKRYVNNASCEDGHYVCDECHEKKGVEIIMEGCLKSASKNPVAIARELMAEPYIYMHGPEHHILVGAALLTAYHNCGGQIELEPALKEMRNRGGQYPGGACGLWGCCGAAASVGMFMSIVTKATPLTGKSWRLSNQAASQALARIAELGGPRCCKRNSFTAMKAAAAFVKEHLQIELEMPETIVCTFFEENGQCLRKHCPYHPDASRGRPAPGEQPCD